MADATVIKQVLENGPRNYVALFTCKFGSGETFPNGYLAIDPTATGDMGVSIAGNTLYPGLNVKIIRAAYDVSVDLGVEIAWDATTDQSAYIFNGAGGGSQNFRPQGGLYVPNGANNPITGATGKLLLNVLGTPAEGDFFSLNLFCRKNIQQ